MWQGRRLDRREQQLMIVSGVVLAAFAAIWLAGWKSASQGAPDQRAVRIRTEPHQPVRRADSASSGSAAAGPRLAAVWSKLKPRNIPRWTEYVHAYRLWSETASPPVWEETPFEQPLFDAEAATRVFSSTIQIATTHGLIYRPWDPRLRDQGDSHVDYTLHVLADTGTPSSRAIAIKDELRSVADVVQAALANYSTVQEQEFTAVALARYLEPGAIWTNKYGQRCSLNDLCQRLCRQSLREGACFGCHRLYALAYLLQMDGEQPILNGETRQLAMAALQEALEILGTSQRKDGSWPASEFESRQATAERTPTAVLRGKDSRVSDLSLTAHTLEWLALAPADVHLDQHAIDAACAYLVADTLDCPDSLVEAHYPAFCHVGCALRDWYPGEWRAFQNSARQALPAAATPPPALNTPEPNSP